MIESVVAHEPRVIVIRQPKLRVGEVASKNMDARIQKFFKARKIQMQLQRTPQTLVRFLLIARAHQQVQRIGVTR